MTRIIAHRGSSRVFPENSLAAFNHAVDCGADMLEVDLRRTADGKIYCFHDKYLSRTTGCKGEFEHTDSAVIDRLSLYNTEPIVSFSSFLEMFGDKVGLVLDIKSIGVEGEIVKMSSAYSGNQPLIYSSFKSQVLVQIRALNPDAEMALIVGPLGNLLPCLVIAKYLLRKLAKFGCTAVHLNRHLATRKIIGKFRDNGIAVSVWTVDKALSAQRYLDWGAEGIITNTPESLIPKITALKRDKPRPASGFLHR